MTDHSILDHIDDLPPLPDELDCEICLHKMRIVNEHDIPTDYYKDQLFKETEIIKIPTKSRIYVCDNCYARVGKVSRLGEIETNGVRHYMRKEK